MDLSMGDVLGLAAVIGFCILVGLAFLWGADNDARMPSSFRIPIGDKLKRVLLFSPTILIGGFLLQWIWNLGAGEGGFHLAYWQGCMLVLFVVMWMGRMR